MRGNSTSRLVKEPPLLRSSLRRAAGFAGAAALTVATVAVLGTPSYAEPITYPTCRSAPSDVEVLSIDYAKGTATVKLSSSAECEEAGITLASYEAQSNTWATSRPQYLHDSQTQIVPRGKTVEYKVKVPDCYWQVDLFFGRPIETLVEGGPSYSSEGRLIDGKLGGDKPCVRPTHTPTPTAEPTNTETPSPTATPTETTKPTPTRTRTPRPTHTVTPTHTATPTHTVTPTETATTAPPTTSAPQPTKTQAGTLPRTGGDAGVIAALGGLLLAGGATLAFVARRRSES
jgi:LPXTG-motif cell wall-anchored protein